MPKKSPVAIWAVDPFEKATKPMVAAVKALDRWAAEAGVRLQPVYVLSLPLREVRRGSLKHVERMQDLLESFVGGYELRNALPAEVLLEESDSRLGAVKEILGYAKRNKAAWIALSSHGRSGFKRFVFGSFAENLLHEAKCPVLFLSKGAFEPEKNAVLFPTDFTRESRSAFRQFLPLARGLNLELVLFHSISLPMPAYMGDPMLGLSTAYIPEKFFPAQRAWAGRKGAAWVKAALASGVRAQLVLSEQRVGLVTGEAILRAAKKAGAGLIVMASQGRPVDRILLGSAAYEVFRGNQYPVWMFGPKALAEKALRRAGPAKPAVERRVV
jgi:nucleotide-binding universal stress UspA family protein